MQNLSPRIGHHAQKMASLATGLLAAMLPLRRRSVQLSNPLLDFAPTEVMDILEILQKDPDQAVQLMDDRKAKAFLSKLGIAQAFVDDSNLSDKPTVQVCGFDGIRTHFVIAFLFSGLTQTKGNGYLITCTPRSGFAPGLSTADFVAGVSREQSLKGLRVIVRTPPSHN
jgi:hypothetical protein